MFSGIVEEVGTVTSVTANQQGCAITIKAPKVTEDVGLGDSISINGTCLTVVQFDKETFVVEAIAETLRRTTLNKLVPGSIVNLERALRFSDRLGGHLVSGHVDAVAKVIAIEEQGSSSLVSFRLDPALAPFFVEKGSVAIDGVSLTVVDFPEDDKDQFVFRVALIPHTLAVTGFRDLTVGNAVNIETDIIARYVARWLAPSLGPNLNKLATNLPFLVEQS